MLKNLNKICSAALLTAGITFGAAAQQVVSVQDSISTDTHWTCASQYLLKGYVYVTSGATLTIDPGVIIKGDKQTKGSLIIERGAKIEAAGTADAPIVFTSNEAPGNRSYGDWGGLIICGKAPQNWSANTESWAPIDHQVEGGPRSLYGGNTPDDNSGTLSYVRIEFPGIAFSPNNEVNGLSLYSVGSRTTIDHIQVSYSGDDAIEWFGGRVNAKYLVAYETWDDDFDTDNGYQGLNQFGMALRAPFAADQSGSKAWESDSWQSGTIAGRDAIDTQYLTKPVFANFTAIGPLVSPQTTSYDPNYVAGVHMRRGTSISILNSIIAGFPIGVLIDEPDTNSFGGTIANWASGSIQFKNNAIAGIPVSSSPAQYGTADQAAFFVYGDNRRNAALSAYLSNPGDSSVFFPRVPGAQAGPFSTVFATGNNNHEDATEQSKLRLQNPFNLSNPDLAPTSTSSVVSTSSPFYAPDSASYRLQNPFFTQPGYIGAFQYGATKWTAGWTNFDPVNTDYSTTCSTSAIQKYDADKLYLQVAPNPAKDNAVVGYTLPEGTSVTIELFDVLGHKVANLFNDNQSAGKFAFRFETTTLNSGVYFINVTTKNAHQAIKLVVAK